MPMRNSIRRSTGTSALRRPISRCVSTAPRTASTTLANSTKMPSPVILTIRPRCSLIIGSTTSRRSTLSLLRYPPHPHPPAASSPRHRPLESPPTDAVPSGHSLFGLANRRSLSQSDLSSKRWRLFRVIPGADRIGTSSPRRDVWQLFSNKHRQPIENATLTRPALRAGSALSRTASKGGRRAVDQLTVTPPISIQITFSARSAAISASS